MWEVGYEKVVKRLLRGVIVASGEMWVSPALAFPCGRDYGSARVAVPAPRGQRPMCGGSLTGQEGPRAVWNRCGIGRQGLWASSAQSWEGTAWQWWTVGCLWLWHRWAGLEPESVLCIWWRGHLGPENGGSIEPGAKCAGSSLAGGLTRMCSHEEPLPQCLIRALSCMRIGWPRVSPPWRGALVILSRMAVDSAPGGRQHDALQPLPPGPVSSPSGLCLQLCDLEAWDVRGRQRGRGWCGGVLV